MLKRTALFERHSQLGARLVEFGGWEMPVHYTSIKDEHLAVRTAAGLFDISHMGEFTVFGADALAFLNSVLTNDLAKLFTGQGQYTLICNPQGGTVDDLYAYRIAEQEYLLIVNASRIEHDFDWLTRQLQARRNEPSVQLLNRSAELGAVAVQGPRVAAFIDRCFPGKATSGAAASTPTALKKNQIARFQFRNLPVWVARTGYTGEDGFEIIAANEIIGSIWDCLLAEGTSHGLKPAGLGARDTLRTEMGYPLFGHELDEETTPLEAGLSRFVAFDKPEFVGRSALLEQKLNGVQKQCIALVMSGNSPPPRPHYPIWTSDNAHRIGHIVSGTQSPSLQTGIGLGFVPPQYAEPGTPLHIEIRGNRFPATVVKKPFYKKPV